MPEEFGTFTENKNIVGNIYRIQGYNLIMYG